MQCFKDADLPDRLPMFTASYCSADDCDLMPLALHGKTEPCHLSHAEPWPRPLTAQAPTGMRVHDLHHHALPPMRV